MPQTPGRPDPGWPLVSRVLLVVLLAQLGACSMPRWPLGGASAPPPAAMQSGRTPQWGDPIGGVVPNPAAADPGYLIGPEDALEISVWKDETLKSTTLVRPDGAISFPLAGDLPVAGKTVDQVREELVRRLEKFVPEPVVSVAVVRVASYRIYVLGRVNKPGEFTAGRVIDVLQALSLAGGTTPFAEEDEIRIIRRVDGNSISIPFDYTRVRSSGDLRQNIPLRTGDVVLVP